MPVTITHAKSNIVADYTGVVTVGNSSGGTQTMQATDLVRPMDWNSAHQATMAVSASEIGSLFAAGAGMTASTNTSGVTFGLGNVMFYEPFILQNTNSTLSIPALGSWYFDPVCLPFGLSSGHFRFPVTAAAGFLQASNMSAAQTASITHYQTLNHNIALYKMGTGANASRLESVWTGQMNLLAAWEMRVSSGASDNIQVSNSLSITIPYTWDQSGGFTTTMVTSGGTLSLTSTTMASSSINSLINAGVQSYITGSRLDFIPFNTTIPAGNYWLAHMFTSTSSATGSGSSTANYIAGRTLFSTHGRLGMIDNALSNFRQLGQSTSNATSCVVPFDGYLATTTSAATVSLASSDIRGTTGRAYFNYVGQQI